jgi:hypothetical protein
MYSPLVRGTVEKTRSFLVNPITTCGIITHRKYLSFGDPWHICRMYSPLVRGTVEENQKLPYWPYNDLEDDYAQEIPEFRSSVIQMPDVLAFDPRD